MIMMDENLNRLAMRIWSFGSSYNSGRQSIVQIARDVAVAPADGSIYVLGSLLNGYMFTGANTQHCFIIRVDQNLNLINARSFGVNGQ